MRSDATAPISWEDAMWQAEDACALKLAEVMGLKPKTDIFTGIKSDNAVDCAVFDIGKPETGDQFGYVADHFHFRGQVDLYSRDRRQIMKHLRLYAYAHLSGDRGEVAELECRVLPRPAGQQLYECDYDRRDSRRQDRRQQESRGIHNISLF